MSRTTDLSRHEFLKRSIAAVAGLVAYPYMPAPTAQTRGASNNQPPQQLTVDVEFTAEDPQAVVSILKQAGAQKVETLKGRGLTGVEIVVIGLIAATGISNLVIKLLPLWQCGVEVDARGARVLTRKNCDLPRGRILVIKADNTETEVHEPSEAQIGSLIAEAVALRK